MILNHAAADTAVQQKLCPNFTFSKTLKKYDLKSCNAQILNITFIKDLERHIILNHAAADTAVQRKLCQNFKFDLLKYLEKYDLKSCSRRHCGPVEAMPKF